MRFFSEAERPELPAVGMADHSSCVTTEKQQKGSIWVIRINRPAAKNAVDGPTAESLHVAFQAFEKDSIARVAILASVGDTFCAGADLKSVSSGHNINPLLPVQGDNAGPMGPSRLNLTKPVIAAIQGHAVAGGLELAAWADLRVAEEDSIMGVFCRRWGVPLIDGGSVRLPRLIGASRAADLILTGRPVTAQEALQIGLINRIAPSGHALTMAIDLAASLVLFPQDCMRADLASAKGSVFASSEQAALAAEFKGGTAVLQQSKLGAGRFADGAGRGGDFSGFEPTGGQLAPAPRANSKKPQTCPAVVVFDLGGVILDSPFAGITAMEQRFNLPAHAINRAIAGAGDCGSFQRLERGEITAAEFSDMFTAEMSKLGGSKCVLPVTGADLLHSITAGLHLRPGMLTALHCLRLAGFQTAICTNNFYDDAGMMDGIMGALAPLVDNVFESCKLGVRKPELRMFEHVTSEMRTAPEKVVFLDDIGSNLKAAAQHGWQTVKVEQSDVSGRIALKQLSELLHTPLSPPADVVAHATKRQRMHTQLAPVRAYSTLVHTSKHAARALAKL